MEPEEPRFDPECCRSLCEAVRVTHPNGARNNTRYLASALLRNRAIPTGGRRPRRAYFVGFKPTKVRTSGVGAAGDSFPRWEASHGEVPTKACASFGNCDLVGVS